MKAYQWSQTGIWTLAACVLFACGREPARKTALPIVRIAELEIDPAQLQDYKAALREEIQASLRLEPGVLSLYAISLRENPAQIRIFETYADRNSYESHIKTSHFLKYKAGTQHMVRGLKLLETDPIYLGAKPLNQ